MSEFRALYGKPPIGPRTWATWLGVGLLSAFSYLPFSIKRTIASSLATLYTRKFGRDGRHMSTVHINLRACFPDTDEATREKLAHRYFAMLMLSVFHMPQYWWRGAAYLRKNLIASGLEHVDKAQEEGFACAFLITHTVSLDAGLIALSLNRSMTGFYKPFKNPVVDWLIRRARLRFGGKPFARGDGFREIIRRMKDGDALCYLCDEDYGPKMSVFAPFFDHQKATLKMLPKIAKVTNAKVFPMATYLDEKSGQYVVRIQPAIANYPSGDELMDATLINDAIGDSIRYAPEQYLWKLQLFKSCPNGKDSRYKQVQRGELQPESM